MDSHSLFIQVDKVKADIKEIKGACKKIQTINQNMMLASSAEAEAKLSAEVFTAHFYPNNILELVQSLIFMPVFFVVTVESSVIFRKPRGKTL